MWELGRAFEEGCKETCYNRELSNQREECSGAKNEEDKLKAEEEKGNERARPKMEAGVEEELYLSREKKNKSVYGRTKPNI